MYWFARAAVTKYHILGSLKNRNTYFLIGDYKAKIKVSAGLDYFVACEG